MKNLLNENEAEKVLHRGYEGLSKEIKVEKSFMEAMKNLLRENKASSRLYNANFITKKSVNSSMNSRFKT
jgi:hypothetical protein